ncbi:uncharacterized membrane protein YhaH (DUF805 family) [Agromyces flavus]|uniref:Predicted membrane protein n=1 Tax=Agromyces flavus TaxID=589382 RepID=A0A1H1TJM4_9MICO|nr:DUF2207 domain-containing protein [Agromyces flavus]MCP2368411.1 uncharacterized membrane protein YhaH (DUF805 family) [Agromyces flavus]GGI47871.1 hypothetical protein GCM10010932_25590 [Agromyces flavus]SDS60271.1 Predicted membrane protein [Agromyces flavus]
MPAPRPVARVAAAVTGAAVVGASAASLAVALLAAPAVAAEPAAVLPPVRAVPADVDDFTFARFDAVYELGRDADRRSELRTTETLVAVFPEFDQNRGIRRAIPRDYDGHPTDLRIESVTDGSGTPRSFETERSEDGEFELVTIAADDYVHGEQTYVITYHQRNVTFEPDDVPQQEFYWDVNGTGWAQPFGVVRGEVRLQDGLVDALSGDSACYRGYEGSSTPCEVLEVDSAADPAVVAQASSLGPYENLTVAIGFRPGTFEPRDERFTSSPAAMTSAITALLAVATAIAAAVMRAVRWRNHPGRGIIVAEYEPPEGLSLMEAADLVRAPGKGITATILAEAVAGRLRVVETGRKKYAVELVGGVDDGERDAQSVLRALFGSHAPRGSRHDLKSRDSTLATELQSLRRWVRSRVSKEGLRRRPDLGWRVLLAVAAIVAATLAVLFGIIALDDRMGGAWPWLTLGVGVIGALATLWIVAGVRPLTERGRALRDHLEGLREFIRLAEADRIRMLQSPSGAERVPSADGRAASPAPGVDPEQVLRVTERLLPYAVLFGQEREWSDELAALYAERGRQPEWYSGRDGFNAVAFSSGVSSFTSASSTSWSGSSSSSSSGGSGGGGSSGGGGGGGGGGGV